jgi:alkylation response protein AidB-like acyl-CoA dehydrogenase
VDLTLSGEQRELRDRAVAFSATQVRPHWERIEVDDDLIVKLSAQAMSAGLGDLAVRESAARLDSITFSILTEDLAWGDGSLALALANRRFAYRAAQLLGDRDILNRVTERLLSAEHGYEAVLLWPEGDEFDWQAATVAPSVIRQREGRLSIACRNSMARPQTRLLMGSAALDKGPGRYAFYLLDRQLDDVALDLRQAATLGLNAAAFSDVKLAKRLGPHDLIAEFRDEAAYQSFWRTLASERRLIDSAVLLGMARAAFEYALEYSKERMAFGKPISQHQAVGLKLADMATAIEAARLMVWRASETEVDRLDEARVEAAWLYTRTVSIEVAIEAVQVLGGHGYLKLHPVEKWMRDIQFLRTLHDDSCFFNPDMIGLLD